MNAFVITLVDVPESVSAAERCIRSCADHGLKADKFVAIPAHAGRDVFNVMGWPTAPFDDNRFSRPDPCMGCFASHAALWKRCVDKGRAFIICEHDAFCVGPLPGGLDGFDGPAVVNLARPSFGTWKQPKPGIGRLTSKAFMPGLTAYYVNPKAARSLLDAAPGAAQPADCFVALKRFPWLLEAFPWPFECRDEVTTVQGPEGIKGKHNRVRIV